MTGAPEISDRHGRHAMTLVEVLLTLCLLVVLASITWPALDRPMANQRLRKAADVVRVEWTRARVKAMSSGETRLFRYAPENGRYVIGSSAGAEFVADTASGSSALLGGTSQTGSLSRCTEGTLPDGITFAAGETAYDARAEVLATQSGQLPSADYEWSDPILFYPDGTTSTATVQLKNEHDRIIDVFLRGLTGVTTVSTVRNAEGYAP